MATRESINAGTDELIDADLPGSACTTMPTAKIVYWNEDDCWIGYLLGFPDYWTQGNTLEDLEAHLRDLYKDLAGRELPGIRRVAEIAVA